MDNVRVTKCGARFAVASEGGYAGVCAIACGDHCAVAAANKGRVRSVAIVVVVELLVAAEIRDGEEIRERGG